MKMDVDKKALWLHALRSGAYVQGTGYLKRTMSDGSCQHCCLGVLIEVAIKDGVKLHTRAIRDEYGCHVHEYDFLTGGLPNAIVNWAGLTARTVVMSDYSAADWNDKFGKSFIEIADMIEAEL